MAHVGKKLTFGGISRVRLRFSALEIQFLQLSIPNVPICNNDSHGLTLGIVFYALAFSWLKIPELHPNLNYR
jgi:hypothetical protein